MLAIIPARAGSKGLPGKNIKLLNGKPLIAFTIEAALKAEFITRVIVNTDSFEIAEVSRKFGAEVPFMRPKELATDKSKSIDVFNFILRKLKEVERTEVDAFTVLQPTSPLRTSLDIDGAIKLFTERGADSVVSYCKEQHPIKWHKYLDESGRIRDIFENKITSRQEEKISYFPNGAIFIFKSKLIEAGMYYSTNSYAYIMDSRRSVDIDTEQDFEYAEYLLKKYQ